LPHTITSHAYVTIKTTWDQQVVLTVRKSDLCIVHKPLTTILIGNRFCATQKSKNHQAKPHHVHCLSLGGESGGEALHVLLELALVAEELDVGTVHQNGTSSLLLQVLLATEGGEAPVLGDDDLLPAGELVLGAAEGLESGGLV